jgi:hypothetical protein
MDFELASNHHAQSTLDPRHQQFHNFDFSKLIGHNGRQHPPNIIGGDVLGEFSALGYSQGYHGHVTDPNVPGMLRSNSTLAVDDPRHSVHYPPYRILLNEFISLKGETRVLEVQVMMAQ